MQYTLMTLTTEPIAIIIDLLRSIRSGTTPPSSTSPQSSASCSYLRPWGNARARIGQLDAPEAWHVRGNIHLDVLEQWHDVGESVGYLFEEERLAIGEYSGEGVEHRREQRRADVELRRDDAQQPVNVPGRRWGKEQVRCGVGEHDAIAKPGRTPT